MPRTFKTPEAQQTYETTVLGDFQAQELAVTSKAQYSQLLCEALIKAADANLSKTSYRLLNYLNALYPFSDRYFELPSQGELALRLGVTRQSINSAQAEIQAAGLWDFKIERWKGRSLMARDAGKVSKKADRCKEDLTPLKRQECQKESTGCQKESTGCKEDLTPLPLEPLLEKGFEPLQTSTDLLNLKDQDPESISFCLGKEPEVEIAAAITFDSPICEPVLTQEGECSGDSDPQKFKNYASSEVFKERPKLKSCVSFEAQATPTKSPKALAFCDMTPSEQALYRKHIEQARQLVTVGGTVQTSSGFAPLGAALASTFSGVVRTNA